MHAKINNNGNSKGQFLAAFHQLSKANAAFLEALNTVNMDVIHGRNYQSGQSDEDREEDIQMIVSLRMAHAKAVELETAIGGEVLRND